MSSKTRKCPYCFSEIPRPSLVCRYCQQDLPPPQEMDSPVTREIFKKCPNCDSFIPDRATICQYCNARQNEQTQEKAKKPSVLKWIGAVMAIVFFACVGLTVVGALLGGDNSSTNTARPLPTATVSIAEIKQQAVELPYDELARNTERHVGKIVHYRGEVIQVLEGRNGNFQVRINVTEGEYFWDDTVFVHYRGSRLLEDDIVEMWARIEGRLTYEALLGNQITIPELTALVLERR